MPTGELGGRVLGAGNAFSTPYPPLPLPQATFGCYPPLIKVHSGQLVVRVELNVAGTVRGCGLLVLRGVVPDAAVHLLVVGRGNLSSDYSCDEGG